MQAGLSLAPLSLSMFGMAMLAGRKAGNRRPADIVLAGFALSTIGMAAIIPLVPRVHSGWYLVIPLLITGSGLGLLVSQLNNFTLAPIAEDRVPVRPLVSIPPQAPSGCPLDSRRPEASCSGHLH